MLSVSDILNSGVSILRYSGVLDKQRTIIVSGLGRSGTTAMIGAIFKAGVKHSSEYLAPRTLDDWKLGTHIEDKDTRAVRKEIVRRDDSQDVWAFKWHMVQDWYEFVPMFRNPYLVVMMRDSLAISIRSQENSSKSIPDWIKQVGLWNLQLVHSLVNEIKCPTILVSYEKLIMSPEVIMPIVLDFCGYRCDQDIIDQVSPTRNSYTSTKDININPWLDK